MAARFWVLFGCLAPAFSGAMVADDPIIYKVLVEEAELRYGGESGVFGFDAEAWIGKDLDKLWLKIELERAGGEFEEAETHWVYSRAVAPFWDVQIGWRRDWRPAPARDFLALGFKGLAPYFFEVDAALFVGRAGRVGVRLDGEYSYALTRRLALISALEINAHRKEDAPRGVASGVSDIELGLRCAYVIRSEVAPYIGINWSRQFGDDDHNDVMIVAGMRVWF